MENQNNNYESGDTQMLSPQNDTKKTGNSQYAMGFVTGFLAAVTVGMLIFFGPSLYRGYIKHETDPKTKMFAIYNLMKKNYIDDIDKEELYEGIYTGMAAIPTDDYSYYMSKEDTEAFNEKTDGNYVGIGVTITGDHNTGDVSITAVYKPSPADECGIKKDDVLLKAAGVAVTADNMDEAVDLVRGPDGTTVDLELYRPSEQKEYKVTCYRRKVEINTVFGRMLDKETGYIRLTNFEGVTAQQYKDVVEQLNKEGMKKLIIDLRNNPGGLLTTVSEIADTLIPKGVLTYTEDKNGKKEYVYTDDNYMDIPLCVLVNKGSASASELLSGAVQDTGRGKIVGRTTFGKGVVQDTFYLSDGSALKLTTSRYYTPNGKCIDGIGITPDIDVKAAKDFELPDLNDENAVVDIESDLQLKAAYEELK